MGSLFGLKMIETENAMREEITEEVVSRSWVERFFDPDPTFHLWDKTKIIQRRKFVPAMFRMNNMFLYHPAFKEELYKVTDLTSS